MKQLAKRTLAAFGFLMMAVPAADAKTDLKKRATIWYEAFDKHDAKLLDEVLNKEWQEFPAGPDGKTAGFEDVKKMLVKRTTTFPDFQIKIDDSIQEGNKVVVRSTITGTQAQEFHGFPSKGRKLHIQAIDIHEFKNGKIIRTWHSEDWLTGLGQLGVFEK